MNQILISEDIYLTPAIKRKRLIYKINFFVSLVLMVVLFGYYGYTEYQKYKDSQKSEHELSSMNFALDNATNSNITLSSDAEKVLLDKKTNEDEEEEKRSKEEEALYQKVKQETTKTAPSGDKYFTIGKIDIPSLNVSYAIINKTTDELLKISPTKFWGPDPNKKGNLCIVGHNYRNTKFFSKVPKLKNGDIIKITDIMGRTVEYAVYDIYTVEPQNVSATSQKTHGKREITLITCTNDAVNRFIVKAREVGA